MLFFSTVGEELKRKEPNLFFLCVLHHLCDERDREEEEVCESRSTTRRVNSGVVEPEAGETAQLNMAAI